MRAGLPGMVAEVAEVVLGEVDGDEDAGEDEVDGRRKRGNMDKDSRILRWLINERSRIRRVGRIIIGASNEQRRLRGEVGCLVDF